MTNQIVPGQDEADRAPFDGLSLVLNAVRQSEEVLEETSSFQELIVRRALLEIVPTSIEGLNIYITGNGPYNEALLQDWVERLGAFAKPDQIDMSEANWFVIGRTAFDAEYLQLSVGWDVRYSSQEDFLSILLFGEEATARNPDYRISLPHPGLEWVDTSKRLFDLEWALNPSSLDDHTSSLASDSCLEPPPENERRMESPEAHNIYSWPDVSEVNGNSTLNQPLDLEPESELAKLGYSVARQVSLTHRHSSLELCVRSLGLPKVANHLAWLIRFRGRNPQLQDAVLRWRDDLDWLRSRYEGQEGNK